MRVTKVLEGLQEIKTQVEMAEEPESLVGVPEDLRELADYVGNWLETQTIIT